MFRFWKSFSVAEIQGGGVGKMGLRLLSVSSMAFNRKIGTLFPEISPVLNKPIFLPIEDVLNGGKSKDYYRSNKQEPSIILGPSGGVTFFAGPLRQAQCIAKKVTFRLGSIQAKKRAFTQKIAALPAD